MTYPNKKVSALLLALLFSLPTFSATLSVNESECAKKTIECNGENVTSKTIIDRPSPISSKENIEIDGR